MSRASLMRQSAAAPTRIMVFGTFDVVHPGHEHFFMQARELAKNPYLIVSIARDSNVKRIKGESPLHDELKRLKAVAENGLVDKAVLGAIDDHIPHIVEERPQIIGLGYDQREYIRGLKTALAEQGIVVRLVRLEAHQPEKYKSSKIKQDHAQWLHK